VTTDGPCRVALVGMMGSGKSTIGRLLSEATGWRYLDNDELVRRAHGTTARALLAERGEPGMRRAESDALALGLELPPPAIVSVAGGVILDALDRDRLRAGAIVVWLRADAAVLESRAVGAEHRPWLDSSAASWMRRAVAEREPLYASVADLVLDTVTGTPAVAAEKLHRWLLAATPCAAAGPVRGRAPD
jgi:shikimate kinase